MQNISKPIILVGFFFYVVHWGVLAKSLPIEGKAAKPQVLTNEVLFPNFQKVHRLANFLIQKKTA